MKKRVQPGDKVFIRDIEQFGVVRKIDSTGRVELVEIKKSDGTPLIINVANRVVDFAKVVFPKASFVISILQGIANFFWNRKKNK